MAHASMTLSVLWRCFGRPACVLALLGMGTGSVWAQAAFDPRPDTPPAGFQQGTAPGSEEQEEPPVPMAAVIRGLDKITARVREYTLPVNTPLNMGAIEVTVRACHARPPEEPPESTAFLEVVEKRADGSREMVFTGWMFASSPALNPLEHPVYDVWVMSCKALDPLQGASRL